MTWAFLLPAYLRSTSTKAVEAKIACGAITVSFEGMFCPYRCCMSCLTSGELKSNCLSLDNGANSIPKAL